jgi:membrane fusion protein, copper/silver efflux system
MTAQDICYLHNCPKMHDGQPCPMLVVATDGEAVTCPVCSTHIAEGAQRPPKAILYWTAPMLPGFKSDKPGKSPMGMDLVPVYEEIDGVASRGPVPTGYAPILVTPQKQQLLGVKVSLVQQRVITKTIRTVGTVAHDPALYQAQAEYLHALNGLRRLPDNVNVESRTQAERLVELSSLNLHHMGWNDALITELGTQGVPERSLLIGQAGGRVWIYAPIYEYEVPFVDVGAAVSVELQSGQHDQIAGRILAIDPMVDAATRTVRVRIALEDTDGRLKPDMYVNISLASSLGTVVAIPDSAVFDTGTQTLVFIDRGQGIFEPRTVRVGAKAEGYYVVLDGVQAGERVVTNGNFLLDSESRLKGAMESMGAGGHQHGQ